MNKKKDIDGMYRIYRQVSLYLIGLLVIMTVVMYLLGVAAGLVATAFTAIYAVVVIVVYLRMNVLEHGRYVEFAMEHGKMQKELIKENKRDYTNENHWNLKAEAIEQLSSFLTQNLK